MLCQEVKQSKIDDIKNLFLPSVQASKNFIIVIKSDPLKQQVTVEFYLLQGAGDRQLPNLDKSLINLVQWISWLIIERNGNVLTQLTTYIL